MPQAHNKASAWFDGLYKENKEINFFKEHGLTELTHEVHTEESKISNTRFRVLYTKEMK